MNISAIQAAIRGLTDAETARLAKWFVKHRPELWPSSNRSKGKAGEDLVARLTSGRREGHTHSHDVTTVRGKKLEVKWADCLPPKPDVDPAMLFWTWNHLFGEHGRKKYQHLILVGKPNPDCKYLESPCDQVLFAIPYGEVSTLLKNPERAIIQLNTDYDRIRKSNPRRLLFEKYQITSQRLRADYGKEVERVVRQMSKD